MICGNLKNLTGSIKLPIIFQDVKQNKASLQLRIFVLIIVIVFISVSVKTFLEDKYFKSYILKSGAEKVLYIAQLTAMDSRIIDAFSLPDPASVIQPLAMKIMEITNTSFVVVINMNSERYSHPNVENLGKKFVGGDEKEALKGKTYVSEAHGTLGLSKRAFVPVYDNEKRQIGVVSVGLLVTELEEKNILIRKILLITTFVSITIGLGGGILLSRNIKKTIFGLEPYQIATLLEERDAIISSIKEGIIAVDTDEKVILINDNAKKIIGIDDLPRDTVLSDMFPETKLPFVIETRKEILNQEEVINGKQFLVNNIPLVHKGRIIGAMGSFTDISEIRNLTEKLNEIKSYTDALRAQHHEYLNKLNVISGLIQLKRYREVNDFIVSTVSTQQSISDLLRKNILTPSVSGLLIAKINKAREQHVDLLINPKSFLPRVSKKAAVYLVSIIGNIIENSIESLGRSSQQDKRIKILFAGSPGDIEIRIADNGPGIPPELKDKIFEYGFSLNNSSGGRGIGLFLVKEQIGLLSGTLELVTGGRTEFIIKIPKKNIL